MAFINRLPFHMAYGRLSEIRLRSLTVDQCDTGKSKTERKLLIIPVYVSPESDVLGTCKSFSFTLIASLNSYTGLT